MEAPITALAQLIKGLNLRGNRYSWNRLLAESAGWFLRN